MAFSDDSYYYPSRHPQQVIVVHGTAVSRTRTEAEDTDAAVAAVTEAESREASNETV